VSTAVLSIGSNLGDRLAHLQGAADAMRPWLRAVSPVYETAPWGPIEQDDYLNAVLLVDDATATPNDWLERARAAEQAAGRTRGVRWGPRTLDVDVVAWTTSAAMTPNSRCPTPGRPSARSFWCRGWRPTRTPCSPAGRYASWSPVYLTTPPTTARTTAPRRRPPAS